MRAQLSFLVVASVFSVGAACGGDTADSPDAQVEVADAQAEPDAAIEPPPLPPEGRRLLSALPHTVTSNVVRQGQDILFTGGVNIGMGPDGTINRVGANEGRQSAFGGTANDQLYGLAVRNLEILAVGLTRSFKGELTKDQTLVVRDVAGAVTTGRYYIPSDEALQMRVVASQGTGWAMVGRHQDLGRLGVVRIDQDLQPLQARSFDLGHERYQVATLLEDDSSMYIVASGVRGEREEGVVMALNPTTLVPLWATNFEASLNLRIRDAVLENGSLLLVGQVGDDGFIARMSTDSGALSSQHLFVDYKIRGMLATEQGVGLGGYKDGEGWLGVARSDFSKLLGTELPTLKTPSIGPLGIVSEGEHFVGVFRDATNIVALPFNTAGEIACSDAQAGTSFAVDSIVPEGTNAITTYAPTVQNYAIAVSYEAVDGQIAIAELMSEESSCTASPASP